MSNVTPVQRLTLLLDQSPVAAIQRWHWVLSTGGTLLDGFAIFVLGVAMSLIIADFHIDSAVVGLIGASLVLGAVFGAGIGGPAADRLGRKKLMLIDMVIVGAGAATSALANGPAMLFIGQLLVGMGIGIDFPISSSYISEVVPKRCRARMMVATIACQSMGMLLAAAITLVLLKNTDSAQNWRLFLASEGVIALLFFLLRLSEPDSPHWLMARGRFAEAAHALIRIPLSSANLCSRLRGVPETNTLPIRSRKRKHPEFLSGSGQSHGLDGSGCRPSVSQAWFLACWCSSLLFSCRIPVCMFR